MLYLILIVLLAEAVYQTLYYRSSRVALSSHISFYAMCLSFLLLIFSSSVYISDLNYTNPSMYGYMLLDQRFWNRFLAFRFNRETLAGLMIVCTQCIPFLSFLFILFFTERFRRMIGWLAAFGLYSLSGALLFLPGVQKAVYYFLYPKYIEYTAYFTLMDRLALFYRVTNALLIVLSFALLFYHVVFQIPRYRELKISSYCILICVAVVQASFLYLFYWLPAPLAKYSQLMGTERYKVIRPQYPPSVYNVFLVFQIVAMAALIFALFFQTKYMIAIKSDIRTIRTSKQIVHASSRIFAHYIKNEILAIQSETELAQFSGREEDKDEALRNIRERCGNIWKQLEFALASADSPKLTMARVNLSRAIEAEIEKAHLPQEIRVCAEIEPDVMAQVDKGLFSSVLRNIFSNAAEALSQGNPPEKRLEVQLKTYRNWLCISVRDNGCGIEKQDLRKIFLPFYSSKPSGKNWGIGLTLSQRIVYAHNGRIHIESAKGKYTLVRIILPYYREEPQRGRKGGRRNHAANPHPDL